MPDDKPAESYPVSMRAVALLGLFALGALAFILIDIASGGRLTDCADCKDKGADGAGD